MSALPPRYSKYLKKKVALQKTTPPPTEPKGKEILKSIALILGSLVLAYLVAAVIFNTINKQYFKSGSVLSEQGLKYEFKINKSVYHQGEPVVMTLTIENTTDSPVELYFESHKDCEFIVKRIYNFGLFYVLVDVWNSTYGKYFSPDPKKVVIKPHQKIVYKAVWHQDLPTGELAKPGSYLFMVKLNMIGGKKVRLYTSPGKQ